MGPELLHLKNYKENSYQTKKNRFMKKESGFKWKLGMFVTIGFALIVAGIYLIGKERNMFGSTFRLQSTFHTVSGLKVGNNVRFSGINIRITSDTSVLVEMVLEKDVQKFIKTDASVSIGSEGLVGDRVLMISAGSSGTPIGDNAFLDSQEPLEIDQILSSLKATAENAEIITDQIAEISYNINNGDGAISRLLRDTVFAKDLSRTMNNLRQSSKGLNENMEAAKSSILLRGYFNKKKKEENKRKEKEQEAEKKK
jgi:phospholipid/cholesterol/gamma-HCH transport system substrate-binding protein